MKRAYVANVYLGCGDKGKHLDALVKAETSRRGKRSESELIREILVQTLSGKEKVNGK